MFIRDHGQQQRSRNIGNSKQIINIVGKYPALNSNVSVSNNISLKNLTLKTKLLLKYFKILLSHVYDRQVNYLTNFTNLQ